MATDMEVDRVPQAGTISKIRVENFMCHAHMEIDLIDRVNFITGQNGSGKSAILTAICVAFGSNAKGTNRANTLKDFIKNGCSYALVMVELRNTGDDAFKADLFGDKIAVERRITEGGTSTFTLKDSKGRKAMQGKNAVIELVDHFNIDVDNPCVIMTQDKSREFLHSGTDKEKFAFFYKATQLEALCSIIAEAREITQKAQQIGMEQQAMLEPMKKQMDEINCQIQEVEDLERFQEEIAKFKKQEAWAQVFEIDKRLEQAQETLRKAEDKLVKINERIEKEMADSARAEEALAEKKASKGALDARAEELKAKQTELKGNLQKVTAEKSEKIARADSKQRMILCNRKRVEELQAKVRQIQESIIESSRAQSTQFQESILAKKREVDAEKAEVARLAEEVAVINEDLQRANSPAQATRARLEEVSRKHSDVARYVNRLQNERNQQSSPFGGPKVQRLHQEIRRRQSQFSAEPLGPIGAHLSLLEDEWATAVEVACGQIMDTFIVNNMKDLQALKECAKAINFGNIKIISYGFNNAPYNPAPHSLPHPSLKTVKSVLQCDSSIIMNVLMDHAHIERQVLVQDYDMGKRIAFDRNQRGVKECFMKDGTKMWMRGTTQANVTPQYRVTPRLTKNVDDRIEAEKQELEQLVAEKLQVEQELGNLEHARREIDAQLSEANRRRVAAERRVSELEYELREIYKRADEARGNDDNNTSELEEEILALRREEEDYQIPIAELEAEVARLREQQREAEETYNAYSSEVRQCDQQYEQFEKEMQSLLKTKLEAEHAVKHYTSFRDDTTLPQITQADKALNVVKADRQVAAEKASAICSEEEMNTLGLERLSPKAIAGNIRRLTEAYNRGRARQSSNKEELLNRRERLERRLNKRKAVIAVLLSRTDRLCNVLRFRCRKMKHIVKGKKEELQFRFNLNLMKKGLQGRVLIDTTNHTLSMEVTFPDGANVAVKDTKSLSGGERSFTTLAYALALHDMTQTPFRAMDEFDIFMDAVTRKISLDAVVRHALDPRTDESQWIFITPHDISSVTGYPEDQVKKQSMHAPRG